MHIRAGSFVSLYRISESRLAAPPILKHTSSNAYIDRELILNPTERGYELHMNVHRKFIYAIEYTY